MSEPQNCPKCNIPLDPRYKNCYWCSTGLSTSLKDGHGIKSSADENGTEPSIRFFRACVFWVVLAILAVPLFFIIWGLLSVFGSLGSIFFTVLVIVVKFCYFMVTAPIWTRVADWADYRKPENAPLFFAAPELRPFSNLHRSLIADRKSAELSKHVPK